MMVPGVNCGSATELIDPAILDFLEANGHRSLRLNVPITSSSSQIVDCLLQFRGRQLRPWALLVGGHNDHPWDGVSEVTKRVEPDEFAMLGESCAMSEIETGERWDGIEVGNEPCMGVMTYKRAPLDFAYAAHLTYEAVKGLGSPTPIYTGGIRNLNREALQYLKDMRVETLYPKIGIAFHRYPEGEWLQRLLHPGPPPQVPHRGYASRAAEFAALHALTGARQVACTEFGYSLAGRPGLSEAQQAEYLQAEFAMLSFCSRAHLYQVNSGRSGSTDDNYGLRDAEGRWRPAAYILNPPTHRTRLR